MFQIFLIVAVFGANAGEHFPQEPLGRYSVPVRQPSVRLSTHTVGYPSSQIRYPSHPREYNSEALGYNNHLMEYASHPVGYINGATAHPVGYITDAMAPPGGYSSEAVGYTGHHYSSHPVAYAGTVHKPPLTVYSVPGGTVPYFAPAPQLSVLHGPFRASGQTVYTPHSVATPYVMSVRQSPPCRQLTPPTPNKTNAPLTAPLTPPTQTTTLRPSAHSGGHAHHKVPHALSLFGDFDQPYVSGYHGSNGKDHLSSSQNVFSIGISTPKFDDEPFGH